MDVRCTKRTHTTQEQTAHGHGAMQHMHTHTVQSPETLKRSLARAPSPSAVLPCEAGVARAPPAHTAAAQGAEVRAPRVPLARGPGPAPVAHAARLAALAAAVAV